MRDSLEFLGLQLDEWRFHYWEDLRRGSFSVGRGHGGVSISLLYVTFEIPVRQPGVHVSYTPPVVRGERGAGGDNFGSPASIDGLNGVIWG